MLDWPEAAIPYVLHRSARRQRTLSVTIRPEGHLVVHVPLRTTASAIQKFLEQRRAWILRHFLAAQSRVARMLPCRFHEGDQIPYLGFSCQLRVTHNDALPSGCRIQRREILVNIPDPPALPQLLANEVRFEIRRWYKRRAMKKFQQRLDYYAGQMGLTYRHLRLSNAAQRWGSCSADRVIRLNWCLLAYPLPLLDYVVVHELCHIPHPNHSRRFWRAVAQIVPDWAARRRTLNTATFRELFQNSSC